MTRTCIVLFVLLLLVGCAPDEKENARKSALDNSVEVAKKPLRKVTQEELVKAKNLCDEAETSCPKLNERLQEIADGMKSCTNNTTLCNAVREFGKSNSPVIRILPKGNLTVAMPTSPFFWSIDNEFLAIQPGQLLYRYEIFWPWWEFWWPTVKIPAASISIVGLFFILGRLRSGRQKETAAAKASAQEKEKSDLERYRNGVEQKERKALKEKGRRLKILWRELRWHQRPETPDNEPDNTETEPELRAKPAPEAATKIEPEIEPSSTKSIDDKEAITRKEHAAVMAAISKKRP